MQIRVDSVLNNEQCLVGGSPGFPAYRVHFTAAMMRGYAWLVWSGETPPPQGDYSVETGMEAIRGFQVVPPDMDRQASIHPLTTPGDYRVSGRVEAVWPGDDGGVSWGAYVRVGDCSFTVNSDDLSGGPDNQGLRLRKGDWVEFEVGGLSLWDENL